MSSSKCTDGVIFTDISACMEVCQGRKSPPFPVATSLEDAGLAPVKVVQFYSHEFIKLGDGGLRLLADDKLLYQQQIDSKDYVMTNNTALVCLSMSDCFKTSNYWNVVNEQYHKIDQGRRLFVKSIRKLVSYGEFYLRNDSTAVVCSPKLSDDGFRIWNGIFSALSLLFLVILIFCLFICLKGSVKRLLLMNPGYLLLGYFFQFVTYVIPCPAPILSYMEKSLFLCSFIWLKLLCFHLYMTLKYGRVEMPRIRIQILCCLLVTILSSLPCCIQNVNWNNYKDLLTASCDFAPLHGQYVAAIFYTVMMGILMINSGLLYLCKLEMGKRDMKSTEKSGNEYTLTVHLEVAAAVYVTLKTVWSVVAIEEVESIWFFIDVPCQMYGILVFFIFFHVFNGQYNIKSK